MGMWRLALSPVCQFAEGQTANWRFASVAAVDRLAKTAKAGLLGGAGGAALWRGIVYIVINSNLARLRVNFVYIINEVGACALTRPARRVEQHQHVGAVGDQAGACFAWVARRRSSASASFLTARAAMTPRTTPAIGIRRSETACQVVMVEGPSAHASP